MEHCASKSAQDNEQNKKKNKKLDQKDNAFNGRHKKNSKWKQKGHYD